MFFPGAAALANLRALAHIPQNIAFELPESAESVPFKWQKLHNLILSLGDLPKVLEGTHENYTKAHFNDPTFEKVQHINNTATTQSSTDQLIHVQFHQHINTSTKIQTHHTQHPPTHRYTDQLVEW